MSPFIRRLLRPPRDTAEDVYGAAASLHVMALFFMVLPAFALPIQILISGELRPAMLANGFLMAIGAAVFQLNRAGHLKPASWILMGAIWSTDVLLAALLGQAGHAVLGGLMVVVMMAGLLLGGRAALRMAGLSALAGGVLLLAESNGVLVPVLAPMGSARTFLVVHLPHLVFCAFVIRQFVGRSHAAVEQALAAARAEAEARKAVEATSRAKTALLGNVSHELRTPLSVIVGVADLLDQGSLSPDMQRYVHVAQDSARSLERLVGDLLDVRAIEAGVMTIVPAPVSLTDVVRAVVERHEKAAEAKGLTLAAQVKDGLPPLVLGDRDRLVQVLSNLVGNGVKYTDEGSVTLSVDGLHEDDGVRLVFTVADTGLGIPDGLRGALFEPFTRVERSTLWPQGGLGLGLSIAKKLIDAMDGEIHVASTEGSGSTITVRLTLPVVTETSPTAVHGDSPTPVGPDGGPSVLVVDDAVIVRQTLSALLSCCGCAVTEAASGKEAVESITTTAFDLVLMDVQMPVMDGFAATQAMRRLQHGADVPIVAVSAQALAETLGQCLEAGMNDLLVKPFTLAEVRRVVETHAARTRLPHPR